MPFVPKTPPWADGPAGLTPITAAELTRIETGIATVQSEAAAAYQTLAGAVSAITRDGSNRITGLTEGGQVWSAITRNGSGQITAFTLNGTVHTVTRDGSGRVTGVS